MNFPGIEKNKPLAKLTTFQIGGEADYFYELKDIAVLPQLIELCKVENRPFVIVGWGSNTIFSDKGFRGLVIHNVARKMAMDGDLIVADSGTLLSQIIQFSLKHGLTGMEKLMGVPGTIGGAVRGNAGAFGLEIKDLVEKVELYRDGVVIEPASYLDFGYRSSKIKKTGEIILRVWLRLQPGDTAKGVEEVRQIIISRAGKHPNGMSSGSFFKNPSGNSIGVGHSAGWYLDQTGCKGMKVGGAYVSEKHANFLMNDGSATLADVVELCSALQRKVEAQFKVKLEREVQLVDEQGLISN